MGALTFKKLFFNKYTLTLSIILSVSFVFYTMSNKIETLEESLQIQSSNVDKLEKELVKTNDILVKQEKELLEQVDNILILESDKQILNNNLQKHIEKRNKKDVDNIIIKKTKLTEITINKFIKNKVKKYNNRKGVK